MSDILERYVKIKRQLLDNFGCSGDYFLKILEEHEWNVAGDDLLPMLRYRGKADGAATNAVIVKKDGAPLIFSAKRYTMVVAIDCVKIGFIFINGNRNEKL